jgi:curved DNA-binding protein CbpA
MTNIDYYSILGVEHNVTKSEIKKAYRFLSMQFHPDKHDNTDAAAKKIAEKKFKELTEAYETLGDDEKRAAYDLNKQHSAVNTGTTNRRENTTGSNKEQSSDTSSRTSNYNYASSEKKSNIGTIIFVLLCLIAILFIVRRLNNNRNSVYTDNIETLSGKLAKSLDSQAFYCNDNSENIKSYYFIPITANEMSTAKEAASKIASKPITQVTASPNYSDAGVKKARENGYKANYGVLIYEENGKIFCGIGAVRNKASDNHYVPDQNINTNSKEDVENYLRARGW